MTPLIENATANLKEVLFTHPKQGDWTRAGLIKIVNDICNPQNPLHPSLMFGINPSKILQAFCDSVGIDKKRLTSALRTGNETLSAAEWYKFITVVSLYADSSKTDLTHNDDKVVLRNNRGALILDGSTSHSYHRLTTLNYDEILCILVPEFNPNKLRIEYGEAQKGASKLSNGLLEVLFNPENISGLIFGQLNQFVDLYEDADHSKRDLLKDLREVFFDSQVIQVALGTLTDKKAFSPLGKLIAGAVTEFLVGYVGMLKDTPNWTMPDDQNLLVISKEQSANLQLRLIQSEWFVALTDYQCSQKDPNWAQTVKPASLRAGPTASGRALPGGSPARPVEPT